MGINQKNNTKKSKKIIIITIIILFLLLIIAFFAYGYYSKNAECWFSETFFANDFFKAMEEAMKIADG